MVVRCRPGIVTNPESAKVPDQQCSISLRFMLHSTRETWSETHGVSLMPRSATTLPHFSYSDFMKAPSDSGVPPTGVAPAFTSLSCTSGSLSASLTALLSLAISAGGVFAGAKSAYQFEASVLG